MRGRPLKTLGSLLAVWSLSSLASAQQPFDRDDPFDEHFKTGIRVGAKIPPFSGVDQNGKKWNFDSIKGPKGALILFYRSADW